MSAAQHIIIASMASPRWQITPGFDPLWHTWNGETVVFDRFSGDTHLFDAISVDLIQALMGSPLTEAMLIDAVAASLGCIADDEFIALIQTRLQALARLDVIQSVDT